MFKSVFANLSRLDINVDKDTFKTHCCASFLVSSKAIQNRPITDYYKIRDGLRDWAIENPYFKYGGENRSANYYCSRLLEYTWGYLLGNITTQIKDCKY